MNKTYLFTTKKIVENVWTGFNYVSSKYKWVNDLDVVYTNWETGSPKSNSDLCVQIDSNELVKGKWSEISCLKNKL